MESECSGSGSCEEAGPTVPLRVGIACNMKLDRSDDTQAEFDEPETIEAIKRALNKGGFEPVVLEATKGFPEKLKEERPDFVFNIAEGVSGRSREAQIPAILDYYGVPYTGSDAAALAVALDKALTKRLASSIGVKTPPFFIITSKDFKVPEDMIYPVILKPNAEGSSKGISDVSVAADEKELREKAGRELDMYGGEIMAEAYIDGREFTVGIVGNGKDAKAYEPMEIIYNKLRGAYKVYSFEVKRNYRDYISYKCPAEVDIKSNNAMKDAALGLFRLMGCRDFARMDFRMSMDGTVYFIEANPLPGLAPEYSDYPMLAGYNGVSYDDTVLGVLHEAIGRYAGTMRGGDHHE